MVRAACSVYLFLSMIEHLGLQERLLERRRRDRVRLRREVQNLAQAVTARLRERHHRQLRPHLQARRVQDQASR